VTIPTKHVLAVVIVGLLVIELLTLIDSAPGNTISETVWRLPTVGVFAAGFLCGHFFWQRSG
jgi:hypothetical protein